MGNWFIDIDLDKGWFPASITVIVAGLAASLLPLFARPHTQRERRVSQTGDTGGDQSIGDTQKSRASAVFRNFISRCRYPRIAAFTWQALFAAVFFGFGWTLTYLMSHVWVVFGVELGLLVIAKVAAAMGLFGFAAASLLAYRGKRKALSVVLMIFSLIYGVVGVNAVYGQYPTIRSVLGAEAFPEMPGYQPHGATRTVKEWEAAAKAGKLPKLRREGIVRTVDIPARIAHFKPRKANVYLPPAALADNPPRLPVLIALSGQPGSPDRFFLSGRFQDSLNEFAKKHHGIAPIVVSPDHLGDASHNTLCSDTPVYGDAQTYITRDVTGWITSRLPVQLPGKAWGIAGFSMGGTCATHLGPKYHNLYGHIISIGGEVHHSNGPVPEMVSRFYGGSRAAYEDHVPAVAIRKYGLPSQTILFGAGQYDQIGQDNARSVAQAASARGMKVDAVVVAGKGHDWNSVRAVMNYGLAQFCMETGLSQGTVRISSFPSLTPMDGVKISYGQEGHG